MNIPTKADFMAATFSLMRVMLFTEDGSISARASDWVSARVDRSNSRTRLLAFRAANLLVEVIWGLLPSSFLPFLPLLAVHAALMRFAHVGLAGLRCRELLPPF